MSDTADIILDLSLGIFVLAVLVGCLAIPTWRRTIQRTVDALFSTRKTASHAKVRFILAAVVAPLWLLTTVLDRPWTWWTAGRLVLGLIHASYAYRTFREWKALKAQDEVQGEGE